MAKENWEQTPEGRITMRFLNVMREVQREYHPRDILAKLVHASHGDLEEGIRAQVNRELLLAKLEVLKIPYSRWETERRRIAAELAKLDD